MQYDTLGRLKKTIDAISNTIEFKYDANGNQTELIDGNGNSTEFVYDGLNRKTSTIYPAVGAAPATHEDAEYDLVGNRIKRSDCNGVATTYAYDDRNRLDYVTYTNGAGNVRNYRYDLIKGGCNSPTLWVAAYTQQKVNTPTLGSVVLYWATSPISPNRLMPTPRFPIRMTNSTASPPKPPSA